MKNKISTTSKILLAVLAIAVFAIIFLPIWSIYLDAPQYPEGLAMHIWANTLTGDVEIINGLNHYIGMNTIHVEDFVEFVVLPYILAAYALLFIVAIIVGRKKMLYFVFFAFILFGAAVMIDFWKWLYDYGHNLDPTAPIRVPGMAYQPPLIGFKQLLNFGAYSIPAIGGWIAIGVGGVLFIMVMIESKILSKFKKKKTNVVSVLALALITFSCGTKQVEPIKLNVDACEFCKMSISDGRFGSEIITKKGRVYKFDDISCLLNYVSENDENQIANYYVNDYLKDNVLIDATTAWFVKHESFNSPMKGNRGAFSSKQEAEKNSEEIDAEVLNWDSIRKDKGEHHQHGEH